MLTGVRGRSGAVVKGQVVAVGVSEGKGRPERSVDRCGDDGVTVGNESVMDALDLRGVQPDGGADTRLGDGFQISAGHDVAEGECDRSRVEDNRVRWSRWGADQAEVLLVERLRCVEVADLKGNEVGAGGWHDGSPQLCQFSDT